MFTKSKLCLILVVYYSLICTINVHAQSVYFNKRYDYNLTGFWNSSDNIIQVEDGYVISGTTGKPSNPEWLTVALMKIDSIGEKQWVKMINDSNAEIDNGTSGSLIKLNNGYYAMCGTKRSYSNDITLDNAVLWIFNENWEITNTYEYGNQDSIIDTLLICRQVKQTYDSGFILGGSLYTDISDNYFILKTDKNGKQEWLRTFHQYGINQGYSVIQTSDSGYIIGGFHYVPSIPTSGNPLIYKTDKEGNLEWMKNMGGEVIDYSAMLCRSYENSFIVGTCIGDSMYITNMSYKRISLSRIDYNGNFLWSKKYGKSSYYNYLLNVFQLEDGNVIATGTTLGVFPHTLGWILKVNSFGDSIWYREYEILSGSQSMNALYDVFETMDNGIVACGEVMPFEPDTGSHDAWVIKLDSNGCDTPNCDPTVIVPLQITKETFLQAYPNPARNKLTVSCPEFINSEALVCLYDIFGRKARQIHVPKGNVAIEINVNTLNKGLYILRVTTGRGYSEWVKVVVE